MSKVAVNGTVIREWTKLHEPVAPLFLNHAPCGGAGIRFGIQMPGYFAVEEDVARKDSAHKESGGSADEGDGLEGGGTAETTTTKKLLEQHVPKWIPDERIQTVVLVMKGMHQTKYGRDNWISYNRSQAYVICPWIFVGQTALPQEVRPWDSFTPRYEPRSSVNGNKVSVPCHDVCARNRI